MKLLWCWRCKTEVPMLDEEEYRRVLSLRGTGSGETIRQREFEPVLSEYERITGFLETNPNAIYHHRAALYGRPCVRCGKPLRTPQARICAACGTRVQITHPS